jgi:hypothetical protein
MRQFTLENFPASWCAREMNLRSHDYGHYHRRFQLPLDDETTSELETLTQDCERSAAEVIRGPSP